MKPFNIHPWGRPMKRSDIPDELVLALSHLWSSQSRAWDLGTRGYVPAGVIEMMVASGIPYKVALRKVEHLNDRGLLDYGVSPDYSWLTPEGTAILAEAMSEVTSPQTPGGPQ